MLKVAIVGNIASGKSTVENILIKKGYSVYDTDKIAHSILVNNKDVESYFGTTDRKELAQIVFADKEKLKKLESIIHPLVKKEIEEIFNHEVEIVFISVPQLFESGFDKMFDKILYIYTPEEVRINRLIKRNNLSYEEALSRIKAQMPDEIKKQRADYVIENVATIENLSQNVEGVLFKLTNQ